MSCKARKFAKKSTKIHFSAVSDWFVYS